MKWALVAALLLAACAAGTHPTPRPRPPFAGCLPRPAPLPVIATVEQVRARHDALERLYLDCAARLRRNNDAMK